jgi:hypothetical protein
MNQQRRCNGHRHRRNSAPGTCPSSTNRSRNRRLRPRTGLRFRCGSPQPSHPPPGKGHQRHRHHDDAGPVKCEEPAPCDRDRLIGSSLTHPLENREVDQRQAPDRLSVTEHQADAADRPKSAKKHSVRLSPWATLGRTVGLASEIRGQERVRFPECPSPVASTGKRPQPGAGVPRHGPPPTE